MAAEIFFIYYRRIKWLPTQALVLDIRVLGERSLMAQKNEQTALGYFLLRLYKIMI